MLQTKGFWIFCLFYPVFLSLLLFVFWGVSMTFKHTYDDLDISPLSTLDFSSQFDEIRDFFWGDPLHYYVVDRSAENFAAAVRKAKEQRDYEVWSDMWFGASPPSIEEFQKRISTNPNFGLNQILYYRKFREIQEPDVNIETLDSWIENGDIVGYFIIPEEIMATDPSVLFVRPNKGNLALTKKINELEVWFEDLVTRVRQDTLLAQNNFELEQRQQLQEPVRVKIERATTVQSVDLPTAVLPQGNTVPQPPIPNWVKFSTIPFVYLFFVTLGSTANAMVTSTIEEKSSRVAEMLAARMKPSQILDGKLLGNCVVAFIGIGSVCVLVGPPIFLLISTFSGPESNVLTTLFHVSKLFTWLLFLLFGIAFFGYIQTALGSLCDDAKELFTTMYPIALIQMFCVIPAIVYALFNPSGRVTQVLSFIPFLTPSVMVGRLASLPIWPVYLAILLMMVLSVLTIRKFSTALFAHGLVSERAPRGMRRIFGLARKPV